MRLLRKLDMRGNGGRKERYGEFLCDNCGKIVEKRLNNGLRDTACGCIREKHGKTGTRIHRVWLDMRKRCNSESHPNYNDYGGRGIIICKEWEEFKNFYDWAIKNGYKNNLQIDRIDNDGNYKPENCRFVTGKINSRNSRQVKITMNIANEIRSKYKKGGISQRALGKEYRLAPSSICYILTNRTWS